MKLATVTARARKKTNMPAKRADASRKGRFFMDCPKKSAFPHTVKTR
jgi:hypothetical protein